MVTVLFQMTAKAGREAECARLANEVTASTRIEDDGCISYTFYRRSDDPRGFMLFEQWRDGPSIAAHMERLKRVYGPPDDSEPYPPGHHRRRLPKAFLDYFDKTEAIRYDEIE
jgi:quinol monooxygenase YgiN